MKIKLLRLLIALFLAVVLIITGFISLNYIFPLPDKIEYSTIITDNKGEVIHAFLTSDQKWRMKTEPQEISALLKRAIIAKEDKHFYRHPGVNFIAVARAFLKNVLRARRTSGASTITMQVAKALEPKRRTYWNKSIEMFRAFQLEWKYDKHEILQLYLNLVPYGGNIEGVKSASVIYFRKSPDHLSLAEITALSVIPNRPSSLAIGKQNERIVKVRNRWLKRFASDKVFTEKEVEDALREPLEASRGAVPQLLPQLSYKLKKQGGDIIHSNIDLNQQLKIEKLVENYVRSLYVRNIRNAAVIVIDNVRGAVVSYIGSANFADTLDAGQVNGAAAVRQPGSTLKPLLYGLCIDAGLLTPRSVITDLAVNYEGYAPENYDRNFNGFVTMEYALEHSLNIPAVKGLRMLGKDKLVEKLATCQFRQVSRDEEKLGLSLILGGCGASLEELTALYSCFAKEGFYCSPSYVQKATYPQKKRILSAAAAFMLNETLSKVNRPDFPLNWQSTEHMPKIAWKTGTSYGRRDAWSIGYNKRFTVGIWVGNFSGLGIPELSGAEIATPLLFKIFNTIDYDRDDEWFRQPADCEMRMVCPETGMLREEHCPAPVMDYFIPLVSSSKKCDNIKELSISADESVSYCKSCIPAAGFKKKLFRILPTDIQSYYDDKGMAYEKVPKHNGNCERIFKEGAPSISFPVNKEEYFISKKYPEPLQLTCHAASDVTKVYWYINDKFYKASPARSKQFFIPAEGPVKISCTDDKGRNRDIWIQVRYD